MEDTIIQKRVLQEYVSNVGSELTETTDKFGNKKKHWYLKGIFMQGEIQNLNGRIYPRDEINNAISSLQERINNGEKVLGELDHPDTLIVNLDKVSHTIDEIHMERDNGIGKMKILSSVPCGKIVEGFLEEEIPLGVSTRGSGNVDEYHNNVVSDFDIVTIDIVATPSAKDARPTAVYEQLMKSYKGQHLMNAAKDCIANNDKHTKQLNMDIVSFIRNWKY